MVIGRDRFHFATVGSTNDEIIQRALLGAAEGLVVTADEQTAGRGRLGRSWVSPAGKGVHCSVLLRPARALAIAPRVTMMAALAAAEAVESTSGLTAHVKWPNDLLLGDRKLGGVLTEVIQETGQPPALCVGIGLNVRHGWDDFPPEVRATATSMALAGACEVTVAEVTEALLQALNRRYQQLQSGEDDTLEEFRRRDVTLRKNVRVTIGEEVIEGVAELIDENCMLGVRLWDRSRRLFVAGEVTVRF